MKVNEIFYSISGEGVHAGIPTVFIRLQGCNLRCAYCDTAYALDLKGGEEMTIGQVCDRVYLLSKTANWVLITGGEPLLQSDDVGELAWRLRLSERKIEIETNGSIDPPIWFRGIDCWNVDVKCPSSRVCGSFRTVWLRKMRKQDQLKFVVGTQEDLDFVRGFLNGARIRPTILVSPIIPIFPDSPSAYPESQLHPITGPQWWLQEVAEFCKEQNLRYSLQVHKVIWGDKRGV